MTSISSVNAGTTQANAASTTTQKSTLSESTKSKLQALGIPVTDDMTEAEATLLIQQKQEQENGNNSEQSSSEAEILSEAKTLASALGVSVSDDADITTILDDIGAELEEMLESAENNPAILSTVSSYLSQLTSLDEQNDNIQSAREGFYAAMNVIAENKKMALGLE